MKRLGLRPTALVLLSMALIVVVLATSVPAAAQRTANEASRARLGVIQLRERALLAPFLERGPIAFIEFAEDTELPAVILAARVDAPADRVASLIAKPRDYPRFMPALDRVKVTSSRNKTTSYDWKWSTAVFTLQGSNVMTVFSPPSGPADPRGYRVSVRSTRGDFGKGRMIWRVYPEAPNRSLLVLAMRVDMRDANYISRRMAAGGNSINRSINIALGYVMLLASKTEAERRTGRRPPQAKSLPPLHRPQLPMRKLAPMLDRGDLVLTEMHGDRVAQVAVAGRMGKDVRTIRGIMTDPSEFGRSLVQGSTADVIGRDGDGVLFEWNIPLPLVGAEGRMRLEETGREVKVDAVAGALSGGKWRFDTHEYPWGEAAVIGWGRFDPADASWLLERLVDAIPWFGQGLRIASQVMVIRSIRARAWGRI